MPKISESHKAKIKSKVAKRRKTREFAPHDFPDMIVLEYSKAVISEVNLIEKLIKEILFPHLEKIVDTKNERLDSSIKLDIELKTLAGGALVIELMRRIKSKFYGETIEEDSEPTQRLFSRSARRIADKFMKRANNFAEKRFVSEFKNQTGTEPIPQQLNVEAFIKDATRKNIALIKTLPTRYFNEIERVTSEAVSKGQLSSKLKSELSKIKETTKTSSRLLARDQIGKLVAVTSEARQRNLGLTHYIWRTVGDSRTRSFANSSGSSDHARLNGALIPWSLAPVTVFKGKRAGERNHSGMDINCRCASEPVYDKLTGIDRSDTKAARKKSIKLGLIDE